MSYIITPASTPDKKNLHECIVDVNKVICHHSFINRPENFYFISKDIQTYSNVLRFNYDIYKQIYNTIKMLSDSDIIKDNKNIVSRNNYLSESTIINSIIEYKFTIDTYKYAPKKDWFSFVESKKQDYPDIFTDELILLDLISEKKYVQGIDKIKNGAKFQSLLNVLNNKYIKECNNDQIIRRFCDASSDKKLYFDNIWCLDDRFFDILMQTEFTINCSNIMYDEKTLDRIEILFERGHRFDFLLSQHNAEYILRYYLNRNNPKDMLLNYIIKEYISKKPERVPEILINSNRENPTNKDKCRKLYFVLKKYIDSGYLEVPNFDTLYDTLIKPY